MTSVREMSTDIACIKIMLDIVEPAVVRRLEVPLAIRLDRLHAILQAAFGWTNSHLWEFRRGEHRWAQPSEDWDDAPNDAAKSTLEFALKNSGTEPLTYLYDFGDGWEHIIKFEYIVAPDPAQSYPRLVEAIGRCPPEDVGGPPGYEEFLAAIRDPGHERHAEFKEWHAAEFDPDVVDTVAIKRVFATLAKRWSRTPSK